MYLCGKLCMIEIKKTLTAGMTALAGSASYITKIECLDYR